MRAAGGPPGGRTAGQVSLAVDGAAPCVGRLVGRERELAAALRVVNGEMDSLAQLVEIAGDPGVGTTRLLGEFCGLAVRQGRLVLSGRATAFGRDVPFAVVLDALMDALPSLGVSMLRNVAGGDLALLRKGFPGLSGRMADPAAGVERQQLYRAATSLLEVVGWGRGLVLVLDDIHRADAGSVEYIDYLVRHPPSIPFALVLGYRPRQIPPRLSRALTQLTTMCRTRFDLKPLTLGEVAELLGAGDGRSVGPAQIRRLHAASGGNPGYVEFLWRSGDGARAIIPWDPDRVPGLDIAALPGAISDEFLVLGPVALLVARAAAVVGEQFEPDLVAEVAEVTEPEAMAGLDELVAHDLIRSSGPARRFRYRHALVRAAAYQLSGTGWRLEAHTRAARGLGRRGAPAPIRAPHVARCARVGDADAIALLVQAAESAQATAPNRTAHWLDIVIGLLPRAPSGRERLIALMLTRAHALGASGQLAGGRDLFREVLRLLDGQPGEQRAEAVAACAALERLLGRPETAESLLTTELGLLPGYDPEQARGIRAELALASVERGRFDHARAWARQAGDFQARDTPLGPVPATMFAVHAIADTQTGQAESARRHLRPAAVLLDAMTDEQAARHLPLVLEVSRADLALELHGDALRHADRGIALSARTGCDQLVLELSFVLVSAQTQLGLLADAAGTADDMLESAARFGRTELRPPILACQAEIALWQGDARAGLRLARRATMPTGAAGYWWHGVTHAISGWAQLANGDPAGCVREIITPGARGLAAYRAALRPLLGDLLAQAETMAGNGAAARRWAQQARDAASLIGLPGLTAHARLAEARACLAAGDPSRAAAEAECAAAAFGSLRWPGHEGRARHLLGVAHAAAGRGEGAQQEWGRAKELFSACGARGMRVGVLNEQRRLAARMPGRRRSAGTGAASLTSREREIVDLVSAGRTNRQIAERLFLSTKTIETHLTHIFAKLGVTSRSAVAATLAQLDGSAG